MNRQLSIIIIHWNTPLLLKNQLKQLHESGFEIIVVDNNSEDSLGWIENEYPRVKILANNINYGFAFACNQGTTHAVGEWLLFLNPDVEITDEAINECIKQAENKQYDAVSPNPGSDSYQKPIPSLLSLISEFTPLGKVIPLSIFKTKTLFGGCLLIKKKILEQIGGWDERFFLWFEDSDLTKRLIQNQYLVGWVNVAIKHKGGETFKLLDNQTKRNIFFHSLKLYAEKHFPKYQQIIVNIIAKRFSKNKLLPTLNHNTCLVVPNLKKNLLDEFLKQNRSYSSNIEIIITTSALKNNEFYIYKNKYSNIRFILLDQNRGFAKTVNAGFKAAAGEWVGTINDDTIAINDWAEKCEQYFSYDIGSVNPIIKTAVGGIESAGIHILAKGKAEPITKFDLDKEIITVDATNGAAVIYQKTALERVGLYDERFGSYLEDIDLSLRLSRAGYKNIVVANSEIVHHKHQTSKDLSLNKNWLDFKNWIIVIMKNWSLPQIIRSLPQITIERLRNFSGIIKNFSS